MTQDQLPAVAGTATKRAEAARAPALFFQGATSGVFGSSVPNGSAPESRL